MWLLYVIMNREGGFSLPVHLRYVLGRISGFIVVHEFQLWDSILRQL